MQFTRRASRHISSAVHLAVMTVLGTGSAFANTQTSTWAGASGSDWNTATNWSPGGVPNNGNNGISDYNVVIGTPAPAHLDISPTIDLLNITNGGQLIINSAQILNIQGPTVTDNGSIQIDTLGSNADLNFTASTLLTGTGTVMLDDYNPNARFTAAAGATVTQDVNHTISGVGEIDASLINDGTVNANFNGRTLALQTNNMTNNSLFEATANGTLSISGITVTQGTNGQILASGGAVPITSSTISGGTLNSANGSSISLTSSTLNNVTVGTAATVILTGGTTVNVSGGSLVNNGTIQVDTYSSNANLNFTASTTITGTGTIFLDDNNPKPTINSSSGATVTFGSGQTIDGSGAINATTINNGTVNANFNGQTLIIQTGPMTNNSVLEATAGGILNISGITITQGTNGQISAGTTGTVSITNSTISGGTLGAVSGRSITLTSDALNNVSVATGSLLILSPGTTVNVFGGSLVNNGTIQVDNYASNANLNFTATTSVSGTGTIFLDDNNPKPTINSSSGATVTFGSGQTIDGSGAINASTINNGTVNANFNGQTLILQTSPMTNNNLFEATVGGSLNINGITVTQGTNGRISADSTSAINLYGGTTIVGGTINAASGGVVNVSTGGATLTNATIGTGTSVIIASNITLNISGGSLVNNGTLQVDTVGGAADLNFTANTTVTGTGSIDINDYRPNAQLTAATGATVTISAGQTIYGVGEIDPTVINNGTINANYNGQILYLNGTTTSGGTVEASNGGALYIGATLTSLANSTLSGPINVSAGAQLISSGSFSGAPALSDSGTVTFNANPGTGILTRTLTSLSLASTGIAVVSTTPVHTNRTLLVTSALSFSGSTNEWTGNLDLTNNDLDVKGGSLSNITNQIKEGFNGGNWQGAGGITSSAAAANAKHLTTLGVELNSNGTGTLISSFDGQSVTTTDVLVKYTYYGDANLDGQVDGSDYTLIDAGFNSQKTGTPTTGWHNGDFNYDGKIDGSDYTLIDNAFNTQGGNLSSTALIASSTDQIASGSTTSVPEPTSLAFGAIAGLGLLARRRRGSR